MLPGADVILDIWFYIVFFGIFLGGLVLAYRCFKAYLKMIDEIGETLKEKIKKLRKWWGRKK